MRDAARKAKKSKTFVWYNYRRCPAVALAHQLVAEGRIGRVYHVRAHYLQSWGGASTPLVWRFEKKSAGSGAHGDLNAHIIDMCRFVTGEEITEIHGAVADYAERARAGRIKLDELEGGAFAVSNLGMHGVDEFSAILNPPQSGILAVSAAKPRPVVDETGGLAVATVMTVTLSADHRVVDGALAAEWMAAFVDLIEHPVRLLI